jgi:aspartyl-tRNA(Asn)/glutamyl-tRNA(Gln) amidotransferase subunit C
MALSIEQVEHVARLARLDLSAAEKEAYAQQLGMILEYADRINALDTEGVEPLDHILPIQNIFREDRAQASPPPGGNAGQRTSG